MNTELKKIKQFSKLINNAVCGKILENIRKHRDSKLAITEKKKKLVSTRTKLSHQKVFRRKFISYRNKKYPDNDK